jgi:hypothetical protein
LSPASLFFNKENCSFLMILWSIFFLCIFEMKNFPSKMTKSLQVNAKSYNHYISKHLMLLSPKINETRKSDD